MRGKRIIYPARGIGWLAVVLVVGCVTGCGWMGTGKGKGEGEVRPASGAQAGQGQGPAQVDAQQRSPTPTPNMTPQPTPVDMTRPGNPATWGEGARLAAGREFEPIYFDSDSAELNASARQQLNGYVPWFKEHPRVWIALLGHSDSRVGVRLGYNMAMARALTVEDYLMGQGLDRGRIYSISYGPDRPVEQDDSSRGAQFNRRVEILAFLAPAGQESPTPIQLDKEVPPAEEIQSVPEGEDIR